MDLTCKLHILQDLRQAQNARKENELKFCTLKEASTAEIVEKKSRFIANSCHIESKEEAEEKINLIKRNTMTQSTTVLRLVSLIKMEIY